MPLRNLNRLSKRGGGVASGEKEPAPFINKLRPPGKQINATNLHFK